MSDEDAFSGFQTRPVVIEGFHAECEFCPWITTAVDKESARDDMIEHRDFCIEGDPA